MSPAGGRSAAQAREHLLRLLTPAVEGTGHDLEDLKMTQAGRRTLVRVVVDADGGVDLDAIAEVSRVVSDALDRDGEGGEAFAGPYVLEVSSPGVDRPLTEARHWRRAAGRLVTTTVAERSVTGRVLDANDSGVALDIDGARTEIPWSQLGRGKVQVEFTRSGAEDEEG
jgi:ribosome maturation factor RimP